MRAVRRDILTCERLEARLPLAGELSVRFEFTDVGGGNALESLMVANDAQLNVYVQDSRDNPTGVRQAYINVDYDPQQISIDTNDPITPGPEYTLDAAGDTSTSGMIVDGGGKDTVAPAPTLRGEEFLLFSVPFHVEAAGNDGVLDLIGSLSEIVLRRPLFFDSSSFLDESQVEFLGGSIQIVAADVFVTPVAGLSTTEAGGTDQFDVVLTLEPTADVTFSVASSNTAEGTVSASSLTFTQTNWDVPQTITVTGVDDFQDDGDKQYTIILGTTSTGDDNYKNLDVDDVTVTNLDDDTAGVNVSAISRNTREDGTTATFTVTLTSEPTGAVTIPFNSNDPGEGTVPASVQLNATNWSTGVIVTVTGQDDDLIDGDVLYTIVTGDPTSGDNKYNALGAGDVSDVSVTNENVDTATVSITATTGGNEAGPVAGVFTVNQSLPSTTATVISYTVTGTASSGADFTPLSGSVTIPAGSSSATINVPTINDLLVEELETVIVTLDTITSGNTAQISINQANKSASLNLTDNDAATLSIAATTDGSETGPINGRFTVTQSAISSINTIVSYTVGGSATPGSDYTALSRSVTIPAGSTSATIDVPVTDDLVTEGAETVIVTLGTITSGDAQITIGAADQATIQIFDNEVPRVSIAATTNGDEDGPLGGVFTVSQPITTSSNTVVTYTIAGTATAGTDFAALSGSVTIPIGAMSAPINVSVIDDALIEGIETLTLTITNISGDAQLEIDEANDQASITIADNDLAQISIAGTRGGDEAGPVAGLFTVNQSLQSTTATVISYTVTGTASSGADFTALSGSVTIPAGSSSAIINVPIIDDALLEELETVIITLASITSGNTAQISIDSANDSAAIDLADNDSATLSIAATANGNETGPANGQFTITQSAESSTDTVISYLVAGSATPGADYTALSGSVTIPAGSTTATISVGVLDDPDVESAETVIVTLDEITSGDDQITIGAADQATVLISDNEVPRVSIAATTAGNEEGPLGGVFTVSQSIVATIDTVVTYVVSGTSSSGDDFTALGGTVTIPSGATSALVNVPVIDDSLIEGTETLTLLITEISGDTQLQIDDANDEASITIADNDTATISIAATTGGNEAGPVAGLFTVTQSLESVDDTVVSYTVTGTATSGDDFGELSGSVTIPAGSTTATIDVSIVDDAIVEATETLTITLGSISSGNTTQISIDAANDSATIDLADNDSATISIESSANGNELGPVDGRFMVTQSAESSTDTVISYLVSGTATSGDDFTALSGSVTIPAGSTTATINVPVIDDAEAEGAETVIVTLDTISSGDGEISIGASDQATLQISDDEIPSVGITATTDGEEAGPVDGLFTVSQSIATSTDTIVTYSVVGTASSGVDFTALSGSVTIPMGATSATISVPVIDDDLIEGAETVTLEITGISGDALLEIDAASQLATIEIADDETGLISIVKSVDGDEDGPLAGQFTIRQDGRALVDTVILYLVTGSATAAADYVALSGTVTVTAGQTTATILVPINDDAIVEGTESVTVELDSIASGSNELAIDALADLDSVLISDNDAATVGIAAADGGDEDGPADGRFIVTQSAESSTDTVISYIVSGTATAGDDFTAVSGTVTIPAGSTSAEIDISVLDDATVEDDESVEILLDQITNGNSEVSIDQASDSDSLLILDDDVATVSITAGGNADEAGTVDGSFLVTQTSASSSDTVISYTVTGTASQGDDFSALSGTVTIPAGQTSATVLVPVIDDARLEGTETVIIALDSIGSGNPDVTINSGADEATIDVIDDETGLISIAGTSDGSEAGLVGGVFTITQSGATDTDTVLLYAVAGTAGSGLDFTPLSGTVTISANQTSATIDVSILQDLLIEGSENISITLTEITSGDGRLAIDAAGEVAEIQIVDDDTGLVDIQGTTNGAEAGSVGGVLTVTQSGISSIDTVIAYIVTGTATSAADFTPLSGSVTILAGETTATIEVPTLDDLIVEASETVIVTLDSVSGGNPLITINSAMDSGSIQIADNDAAAVAITGTTDGDETGPLNGTVTVTQSAQSSVDTVVAFLLGGTAISGEDFTALNGAVTIAAGTTTATIVIPVIDDLLVERIETVTVMLDSISSGNQQVTIDADNDEGSLQILNNDTATIGFFSETSSVFERAGSHTVTVQLSVPAGGELTEAVNLNVEVIGGTATTPADFSLLTTAITFPAGSQNGATKNVQLSLVDDQLIEDVETIQLGLQLPGGEVSDVSLGSVDVHTVSVIDDPMDATISGRVWVDASGDGALSIGERTVASVQVRLTGTSLGGELVERETTTDSNGGYLFTDLPAGSYTVSRLQKDAFLRSQDNSKTITVIPSQQAVGQNFAEAGLKVGYVNRFRIFARARNAGLFGNPVTAGMIASESPAAASAFPVSAEDTVPGSTILEASTPVEVSSEAPSEPLPQVSGGSIRPRVLSSTQIHDQQVKTEPAAPASSELAPSELAPSELAPSELASSELADQQSPPVSTNRTLRRRIFASSFREDKQTIDIDSLDYLMGQLV